MTTAPAGTLGPYRLHRVLGEGGMGTVHLATGPDGTLVAIKALRPGVVAGEEGRARLAREVASMRRVRGRCVAEVIDADVSSPTPYVVTRFVEGRSLDRVVAAEGPLRGERLVRLARGLADALATVHAAGLVHRDVKPGNVMLDDDDVVLIDFGLAHALDETRLTTTGLLVGTPGYLAPETVFGQPPTAATDVHGWASTVAFAATGHPPHGEGPVVTVLDRIRRGEHHVPAAALPRELAPLVLAGLAVDPRYRPPLHVLRGAPSPPDTGRTAVIARARSTRVDLPAPVPEPPPTQAGFRPPLPTPLALPPPARGAGRVALLGAAGCLVAGVLVAPWVALLGLAVALLAARTVERSRLRLLRRRVTRGARPSDAAVVAAEAPLRAVGAALPTLLQASAVGVLALLVGLVAWPFSAGERMPLLLAGLTALGVAWWGPGGSAVRRGARLAVAPLAAGRRWHWALAVLLVLGAWVLGLVAESYAAVWWPFGGPPALPGDLPV